MRKSKQSAVQTPPSAIKYARSVQESTSFTTTERKMYDGLERQMRIPAHVCEHHYATSQACLIRFLSMVL